MPDWEKITEEPGATPPGTTRQEFADQIGGTFKGVAKGLGRDVLGVTEFAGIPTGSAFKQSVMAPGETLGEKAGIGVGSVGPYMLAPELGLEGLAARGLANAPRLARAAGSSLGRVAQKGLSGGVAAGLQPAESPDERAENEKWGAGVSAGLASLGVVGKGLGAIPAYTRHRIAEGVASVIGGVLGARHGGPMGALYGSGAAGFASHYSHIGRLVADALPKLLFHVGKVRGAPAGAAAVEATEKQPPDWEKLPASPPPASPGG
jgi:hypothetical protein